MQRFFIKLLFNNTPSFPLPLPLPPKSQQNLRPLRPVQMSNTKVLHLRLMPKANSQEGWPSPRERVQQKESWRHRHPTAQLFALAVQTSRYKSILWWLEGSQLLPGFLALIRYPFKATGRSADTLQRVICSGSRLVGSILLPPSGTFLYRLLLPSRPSLLSPLSLLLSQFPLPN